MRGSGAVNVKDEDVPAHTYCAVMYSTHVLVLIMTRDLQKLPICSILKRTMDEILPPYVDQISHAT